jgi:hypothetical protein
MTATTAALAAIEIAERHAARSPSAALCLADARVCLAVGEDRYALRRAVKSLAYSVGMEHADYQQAAELLKEAA